MTKPNIVDVVEQERLNEAREAGIPWKKFDVFVEYAKEGPEDVLIRITVQNRGPEAARLRLLPTLWFRNTWSWGEDQPKRLRRDIRKIRIGAT